MTEEQYFKLRIMLKGCGACTPMYSTLNSDDEDDKEQE